MPSSQDPPEGHERRPAPLADDFRTVAEVAELMRVSKMTVYRLVHSGELPAVRVGRSFRVRAAAGAPLPGERLLRRRLSRPYP